MSALLISIGMLLLLISLAAIGLGLFMATARRTREAGRYFALWWVPAVAASAGVIMRDGVTVLVATLCFLVAGAVFAFEGRGSGLAPRRGEPLEEGRPGGPEGGPRIDPTGASERTTKENIAGRRRRRAS